jgi:hypothetical protein
MIKEEASDDNDDDEDYEDYDESDIDEEYAISNEPQKIFKKPPHFTFDNYFADNKVLNLLGAHGFGATMTYRRDRLPDGVLGFHVCTEKTEAESRKSCIAHFNNPLTMVKDFPQTDETKGYKRVHSTFQSTSSCNVCNFFCT